VSVTNFAEIYKLVSWDILLTKIDYRHTDNPTNTTEYIISRRRMAAGW